MITPAPEKLKANDFRQIAPQTDLSVSTGIVVGLLRMIFPTQLAAMTAKIAPSEAGVFPVFAVVFLLIGGFLSFKAYGRE